MTTMNTTSVINDFKWVLKVLESSKNKDHMATSLRCFKLWETKYVNPQLSGDDIDVINQLRYHFWSVFKNNSNNHQFNNVK